MQYLSFTGFKHVTGLCYGWILNTNIEGLIYYFNSEHGLRGFKCHVYRPDLFNPIIHNIKGWFYRLTATSDSYLRNNRQSGFLHQLTKILYKDRLCVVGRSRNVTTPSGPVDVNVLTLGVLLTGVLWLDPESVGAKVVTLCLQEVGREILRTVAVVEAQRGAESRGRDTPKGALTHDIPPSLLGGVDSLVEKVIKEQVLEVWVAPVCVRDILQEHGSDNATTAPHEGNFGLVELPAVVLGSL